MKAALLLLSFAVLSCAEDKKPQEKKRLESVTWNLQTHKLEWIVQKGNDDQGKFVASSSERYEISPDDAVMMVAKERRGFTQEEAASLHKLLDTLSIYCAESVIWWDKGEGEKLDGTAAPKGQKVDQRKPAPDLNETKPAPDAPRKIAELIALLRESQ